MKANCPATYAEIESYFAACGMRVRTARTSSRHGDRSEERLLRVSTDLLPALEWPGIAQVAQVQCRVLRKGKVRVHTRYVLTSLPPHAASAKKLLRLVRQHWHIENKLHYVRDVTFDEDRSTVRTGNAPRAMASLRNAVIGCFHARRQPNIAAANRQLAGRPSAVLRILRYGPRPRMK